MWVYNHWASFKGEFYPLVDLKNKLKGVKNIVIVFGIGHQKVLSKEKKNDSHVCLIQKFRLCLFSKNTKETKNRK